MICVPDLDEGIEQYRKLGFHTYAIGAHPGGGTHNAIAFNDEDYIELLAIHSAVEAAEAGYLNMAGKLSEFIAAGGGLRYIAVQSDDLAADVSAMRGRGVEVSEPLRGFGFCLVWSCLLWD